MRWPAWALLVVPMLVALLIAGCGEPDALLAGPDDVAARVRVGATPAGLPVAKSSPIPIVATQRLRGEIAFEAVADGQVGVYIMAADGSHLRRVSEGTGRDSGPVWSPDGTRIAYTGLRDRSNYDLFVVNADGSERRRLTDDPAADVSPAWSPDGTKIAFVSDRDGQRQLYLIDLEGGAVRQLTDGDRPVADPVWSPDGARIAYVSAELGEPGELVVVDVDGANQRPLVSGAVKVRRPLWSPAGTHLVFDGWHEGQSQIYRVNADGSDRQQLTESGDENLAPAWSPDGSQLAFIQGEAFRTHLAVMDADGGNLRRLTGDPEIVLVAPSWSPDGRILFTSVHDGEQAAGGHAIVALDPASGQREELARWPGRVVGLTWRGGSPSGIAATAPPPVECSFFVSAAIAMYDSVEQLAWLSHEIVVGTVVEEFPPAWDDPPDVEFSPAPIIYTDYLVQVDQRFRGGAGETLRVRQPGGQIGSCMQSYEPQVPLTVGEQAVLFLIPQEHHGADAPEAYVVFGGPQGYWPIDAAGTITTEIGHLVSLDGLTVKAFGARVREILAAGVPDDPPWLRKEAVPLDVAPLPPNETP